MSAPISPPPLVLSRKPRRSDADWSGAASWFGGNPALGSLKWPRSSLGRPMHPLAEISLAEVARAAGASMLPAHGALAFFVGAGAKQWECGVLHVEEPSAPSEPPEDMPAAFERNGDMFPADAHPSAPRLFPRWPLDMTAVPELAKRNDEPDEDDEDAWDNRRREAIDRRFKRREFFLSAEHAWKALSGTAAPPTLWRSAQILAECLETAVRKLPARIVQQRGFADAARAHVAKLTPPRPLFGFGRRPAQPTPELTRAQQHLTRTEATTAMMDSQSAEFSRFAADTATWARSHDAWTPMAEADVARLRADHERSRKAFAEITRYLVPGSLNEIDSEVLRQQMTGDTRAFAAMPAALRDHINEHYLLPASYWHQMFGVGVDIQGNALLENEENIMLLQLAYDDMLEWRFGDIGVYQFWISAEHLAARNWKAAQVTFEAH